MDVILFVADALRADALHTARADGRELRLVRRFESWIQFPRCFTSAPWTLPASTSLLTAMAATTHRRYGFEVPLVHDNLVGQMSQHERVAVVNNSVLSKPCGLSAGFDRYDYVPHPGDACERARSVLDAPTVDGRPRFLMVHDNVVHDYYLPATRAYYERAFPDRDDYFDIRYRVLSWRDLDRAQWPTMRRIYDACVIELDQRVDSLLDAVDLDDTIVVFLADHGEGFDPERTRIHHGGRVHDDVARVPLAIHLPPAVAEERRRALEAAACGAVSACDVLPTILDLVGVDVPAGLDGRSLLRAHDERRVLTLEDRKYLYLSNRMRLNTNSRGKNMTTVARLRNAAWNRTVACDHRVSAFVDYPHKLVVTEMRARNASLARAARPMLRRWHVGQPAVAVVGDRWLGLELFDLEDDRDERHNRLLDGDDRGVASELAHRYVAGDVERALGELIA